MKSCKVVVGLSLFLTAIGLPASAAQLKAKTAVLVHGAFADGSCWQKVIPYLEKAGLKVIAVQNPLDSLDNDVAATKRAIRNAEGPVVLVGHSWAGAVITEAGNDEKVKSLVYVAAYAPDKGESVHSASSKYPDPESLKTFVKDPDGYLTISEEGIKRYFAADLSPERTGSRICDAGTVPHQDPYRSGEPGRAAREADLHGRCDEGCDHSAANGKRPSEGGQGYGDRGAVEPCRDAVVPEGGRRADHQGSGVVETLFSRTISILPNGRTLGAANRLARLDPSVVVRSGAALGLPAHLLCAGLKEQPRFI
jgi:pimeloyl-ACP methyl ester carboxylesterase